jgi:hypothetical protein
MTWLLTADTHLSDRPKDGYRWGLFKWLAKQQALYDTTATFLLGDITDRKDNHSASLVNRLVEELLRLKPPVYILRGNHDGISPENPYFRFLQAIEGLDFIVEPEFLSELGVAMIPHQPDQVSFDRACAIIPPKPTAVALHCCIEGAIAETGARLTGLSTALVSVTKPGAVYAGDIHRPQVVKCEAPVTYVGAPYHVRFGDSFTPRILMLKNHIEQNLYFPCLHKWALRVKDADEIINNVNLKKGDQVKIIISMAREEVVEWNKYKQRVLGACKELGLEVFGIDMEVNTSPQRERVKHEPTKAITPEDILNEFCKSEKVASNIKQVGVEILKG